MCAAILFGKVNRVQSHANIIFANAVCLQYEEIEDEDDGDGTETERDIQDSIPVPPVYDTALNPDSAPHLKDEENQLQVKSPESATLRKFKAAVNTVSWGGRLFDSFVKCPSYYRWFYPADFPDNSFFLPLWKFHLDHADKYISKRKEIYGSV